METKLREADYVQSSSSKYSTSLLHGDRPSYSPGEEIVVFLE